MVIKYAKLLKITGIFNVLYLVFILLFESPKYNYPRFTLNTSAILLDILILLVFDAVIISAFLLLRNKSALKKAIIMSIVSLFSIWCLLVCSLFISVGSFWKSKTYEFDRFTLVDNHLDDELKIADLKLSDILELDIIRTENFEYMYCSYIGGLNFSFEGKFYLSEKSYSDLKNSFASADEFKQKDYAVDTQNGMSGCFDFDSNFPKFESKTTVDIWNSVIIEFHDDEKFFFLKLSGSCYT